MDAFAQSSVADRRLAFEQAAAARQLSPQILEKDFWVCWTLKRLFALPTIGEHLIFKGGTSLSKIFKVIERFSEDIDVSMDRGFLGFGGDNEPEGTLIKAVSPSFTNLSLGANYQLQVSTDLNVWTNSGSSFTATNSTWGSTNYWDVDNWGSLFFRLKTTP